MVWAALVSACAGATSRDALQGGSDGASGNAGASSNACEQPPPGNGLGPCEAIVTQYSHDPVTGLCLPQLSNWCEGGPNLYGSWDACHASCPDDAFGTCAIDGDCTLLTQACACEPLDELSLVPVNVTHSAEYTVKYLGNSSCGSCPAVSVTAQTSQYFLPVCRTGACAVLDARTTPLTACQSDADCTVRAGLGCCESCGASHYVAVNVSADFCLGGAGAEACAACAPTSPSLLYAMCIFGRCQLESTLHP
ncbi:MAG TPA: BPTI/Kunitz-type proteinase inhibitor domain-containing protein [Polyangiaceae bacterium]